MTRPILSRKLVLETRQRTPDGSGGHTDTWAPLGTVWAQVAAGTGGEARGVVSATGRLRLKITLRAVPVGQSARPRPGQRFREGDRVYAIHAVAMSRVAAQYLVAHCEEETVQ